MTSTVSVGPAISLMLRQPLDLDALLERLIGLEGMGRHMGPVAVVNDQRLFGTEALRRARGIHRGVAAAVHHDPPAEMRPVARADLMQQAYGVEYAGCVARRDIDVLGDMGPDRREDGLEPPGFLFGEQILDLVVQYELYPHRLDLPHLLHQLLAWQPVCWNTEVHHPAGQRPCVVDLDRVAHPGEVVGCRQAARAGTHDKDAPAACRGIDRQRPALARRQVAEEALDRVDGDCAVDLLATAAGFTRVITDPPVHRRQRVVPDQRQPRLAVATGLRMGEPRLDVLSGRAGMTTRRQEIDVDRASGAHRSGARLRDQVDDRREV